MDHYSRFLPVTGKLFLFFLSVKYFRRFAPLILCSAESLCFHSISRCDWFVASSHDFDENKQLDDESTIDFHLIDRLFP